MYTVYTKEYITPAIDTAEVLRYAGVKDKEKVTSEILALLDECVLEIDGRLSNKVCYTELDLRIFGEELDLGFARVRSASLGKNLSGCERIVVFAATVGIELDRLIARYMRVSPTKALLLGAIGAERIESLCDAFCADLRQKKNADGLDIRPRFSPGYGDLALDVQKSIFTLLDCHKHIGLSLNESLLMSPSKSVTAIIGVRQKEER
jgi:hypothetical protein